MVNIHQSTKRRTSAWQKAASVQNTPMPLELSSVLTLFDWTGAPPRQGRRGNHYKPGQDGDATVGRRHAPLQPRVNRPCRSSVVHRISG